MQCASNNFQQQQLTCPKNHILFQTNDIRGLHNNKAYLNNKYICNGCRGHFSSQDTPCHHCVTCQFDLCKGCSQANQAHPSGFNNIIKIQQNFILNPDPLHYVKIVTCEKSHPLIASYCLSQMRPGWTRSYKSDNFVCNTCSGRFDSNKIASHHCSTCQFDLCPGCYQKSKDLNFGCMKNHPLYSVSSLRQFNKAKNSYVNNRYVCNTCRNKFDASHSPSSHCKICSFDLCPQCCYSHQLLIKENVQRQQQQRNIYYQNFGNASQLNQQFEKIKIQEEDKFAPPKEKIQENNHKELSEEMMCIVCLSSARTQLFTPCMHLCTCEGCSTEIVKKKSGCPICRADIQGSVKVYMS